MNAFCLRRLMSGRLRRGEDLHLLELSLAVDAVSGKNISGEDREGPISPPISVTSGFH